LNRFIARKYPESESVLALCWNLILGGEHLSDLEVLRVDPGTQQMLGLESVIAPTTAGEFLRKLCLTVNYICHRISLIRSCRRGSDGSLFALIAWSAAVLLLKNSPARARYSVWLLTPSKFILPSVF
jgi:hypothetical protein